MARQKREFNTLEEFREYQREVSKAWYQRNKEKKKKTELERYYRKIAELKEKEAQLNKSSQL